MDADLVVVGGGAAGLGAARAGVRAGARVLLVSDGEPGGDCTFNGCVPSKTLIESARRGRRTGTRHAAGGLRLCDRRYVHRPPPGHTVAGNSQTGSWERSRD
jgi:pyruvate/2-oxoglutarate dehydrogenase complex dihydrolipoamide dehydrogenase (E3) component